MHKLAHFKKRTDRALFRYDSIPSFRRSDQFPYQSFVLVQRGDKLVGICEEGEYHSDLENAWSDLKRLEYDLNQTEKIQWQQILSSKHQHNADFHSDVCGGSEITITLFAKPKNTKIHWWTYGPPEHQNLADFIKSFLNRAFPQEIDDEGDDTAE